VFGAGAQVGAQLIAFASRFGPHLVQHLAGVGADPLGFGLGSAGGGLGAGGLLLSPPGGGLGGGRVSEGVDPVPQPGTQRGDPVGLGAQRPQQLRAGQPGHRHRLVGVGRGRGAGLGGSQAAAFPPRGDLGVPAALAVLGGPSGTGGRGGGLVAAGVLAGPPCSAGRSAGGVVAGHLAVSFVRAYLNSIGLGFGSQYLTERYETIRRNQSGPAARNAVSCQVAADLALSHGSGQRVGHVSRGLAILQVAASGPEAAAAAVDMAAGWGELAVKDALAA
jgi:hypothetical protein